jgi:hypothetical protein
MKRMSLAHARFELVNERAQEREFLDERNLVIPLSELLALITPYAPEGKTGLRPCCRRTHACCTRLRSIQRLLSANITNCCLVISAKELLQETDAQHQLSVKWRPAQKQVACRPKSAKSAANSAQFSPCEPLRKNSRCSRGYAGHPVI